MYNDVDMVWLADPFPYVVENHDVYFMDDMTPVCMCRCCVFNWGFGWKIAYWGSVDCIAGETT